MSEKHMGETAVFTTRGCWEVQSIELKETIVLLARTLSGVFGLERAWAFIGPTKRNAVFSLI